MISLDRNGRVQGVLCPRDSSRMLAQHVACSVQARDGQRVGSMYKNPRSAAKFCQQFGRLSTAPRKNEEPIRNVPRSDPSLSHLDRSCGTSD